MSKRTLTPELDGAKHLPVRVGWYPIRTKLYRQEMGPPNEELRSYWNGVHFSGFVDATDDDDEAESAKNTPTRFKNSELYWCGLTAPYKP